MANFDKEPDQYLCSAGETLTTNGRWYFKNHGKIERTEHADLIEANKQRIAQNKEIYSKRQAIVEHPFGIIKSQWDFYYIMTKKAIHHA